ncbi:MAG TPA: hypothetical protein VHV27_03540 [Phenylobacterium sp.]|jgi:hypothetical protein|nr:hypothetical protein [Phenylobacterium sp.]
MKPLFLAALLLAPSLACAQPAPATPAPPCADPEHGQFDFWVGSWVVRPTGADKVVAHSLIEKLYGGCAIRENWMPAVSPGGGSLSSYVPGQRTWKQAWVDSSGARAEFSGGWNGKAMVLTGPWPLPDGRPQLVRMTYTPGPDGSVRQAGEASLDGGRTWTPSFDFTYRPAATPAQSRPPS